MLLIVSHAVFMGYFHLSLITTLQGNLSLGFLTRLDTKRAIQVQKMARGLRIYEVEGLYYVAKIKELISCEVNSQLFCTFVFAYAKMRFSHDAAYLFVSCLSKSG